MLFFKKVKEGPVVQEYFYHVIHMLVQNVFWLFFMIILYQQTESFIVLFMQQTIYFSAMFVGTILGLYFVGVIGYLRTYKLSMGLSFVGMILLFLNFEQLGLLYPLFALWTGISTGLYSPVKYLITLREVGNKNRDDLISNIVTISLAIGLVIPVLAGFLADFSPNYEINIIIAMSFYFWGLFMPWHTNKVPSSKLNMEAVIKITRQPHFIWMFISHFLMSSTLAIKGCLMLIVPYLLIGSVSGVGWFISGMGLISISLVLFEKRAKAKKKMTHAFLSFGILAFFNIVMTVLWTTPILVLRTTVRQLVLPIGVSTLEQFDFRNQQTILGKDKRQLAVEMVLVNEGIHFLGRVVGFSVSLMVLFYWPDNQEMTIRYILGFLSLNWIIILFVIKTLHEKLEHPKRHPKHHFHLYNVLQKILLGRGEKH